MVTVNRRRYLTRRISSKKGSGAKGSRINWFLVKPKGKGFSGYVCLSALTLPHSMIGRKVRFRMEIIPEDEVPNVSKYK